MSFLSDLFHGNFSNLGFDLAPSNIFSDFGTDAVKTLENPLADAAIAASIALPFVAPEIGGALGLGAGAADVGAGTADLASASAAAGWPESLDLAGGTLGTAGGVGADVGAALPATATLTAGTIPQDLSASTGFGADYATIGPGTTTAANAPLSLTAPTATGTVTGAATGAAAPTSVASNLPGWVNTLGADIKAVSPIVGLGGLGYNLVQGYEENQAIKSATANANAQSAAAAQTAQQAQSAAQPFIVNGESLTSYLTTGQLPPDWQATVNQQIAAAKAQITQGYASRGMSTDPLQNSALAQDLANVDSSAATLTANLESTLSTAGNQMVTTANQLLQTGLSASQISAELPAQMLQLTNTLNQSTAQALSTFASAIGGTGGGKGTFTLNINPTTGQVTS